MFSSVNSPSFNGFVNIEKHTQEMRQKFVLLYPFSQNSAVTDTAVKNT